MDEDETSSPFHSNEEDEDTSDDSEVPEEGTGNESASDGEEISDGDTYVSSVVIGELPMPDTTGFSVPLLFELEQGMNDVVLSAQQTTINERPLAPLPQVVHVAQVLKQKEGLPDVQVAHLSLESGLTGNMQVTYLHLPPGARTSHPFAQRSADSITYCISGCGLLWQNGWTYPFETTDCVGWKGGTGVSHTIINDSNRDGNLGEDLVLITANEIRDGEAYFFPMGQNSQEENVTSGNDARWEDPPLQGDLGPHPGTSCVSSSDSTPEPQQGYRPSNVINAINALAGVSDGELFANATPLSQETALSGRLGCNLEVLPPGTRSSDPHAHSLEDEFVYIVSGHGLLWVNGDVQPVCEGDAVGFPGGTGIAHNFINDSNADGSEGEPLFLLIIGQNRVKEGDLVYYPLHVEEKSKSNNWWGDAPRYEIGPHNGRPQRPRK